MFSPARDIMFDDFGSSFLVATLTLSDTTLWIAGILVVVTIAGLSALWTVRKLKEMRMKRDRWVVAKAKIIAWSIEVRPVNFFRRFWNARKFARTSYRYTYQVNGVVFEGASTVLGVIDIAYDPRFHAKRTVVESELPIRFLESSPEVSVVNLPAETQPSKASYVSKRRLELAPLAVGCTCVVLFLFSGWRVVSWKGKRHSPSPAPTENLVATNSAASPSDVRTAKKARYSFSSSKKSNAGGADTVAVKR